MSINWFARPVQESKDVLAQTLREVFCPTQVYEIGGIYAIFPGTPREIWCTKTAIRNHLWLLQHIRALPNEGVIREWTRDGYVIAIDFYCCATNQVTVRREIVP